MRTFVIGDIHGNYKALKQCLEIVNFDYENDRLIQLGDVVDRGLYSYECVEELLKIKNLIAIKGNHDDEFLYAIENGVISSMYNHGAKQTYDSYFKNTNANLMIPPHHKDFFSSQISYFIDENNRCYVHGGFDRERKIETQTNIIFLWDRNLWNKALSCGNDKLKTEDNFTDIFIGHTPTINWKESNKPIDKPMYSGGVWNLDTGAGFGFPLTIMNVETKEYFQSDKY